MMRYVLALIAALLLPVAAHAQSIGGSGGVACSGCTAGTVVGYNGSALINTPLTFSGAVVTDTGTFVLSDGTHTVNLQVATASNTLSQRNGTNAQSFRINGGYTDAADQAYVFIDAGQAAANTIEIGSAHAGTAPNGNLSKLIFLVDGTDVLDYGITGAGIFNFHGNSLQGLANTYINSSSALVWGSGKTTLFSTDASNGVLSIYGSTGSQVIRLGSQVASASYPEIVQSGATIAFRVNGNSADASISAKAATFSGNITMASSTTGSGTLTFTNSPCSALTTEQWVPIGITGQSGTWYVPACQ